MLDENTSSPRRTSAKPAAAGNYLVRCGRAYQVVSVVDECGTLFAHHANGCRQVDSYSKFCTWEGPYYTEDAMTAAIRRAEGEGCCVS